MAALPPSQADAFSADYSIVQKSIRTGVAPTRADALDNHWTRWLDYCDDHGLDPFLRNYKDPVPILQVFGQRYRDGRIAPWGRPVKSRTVEDALRAIGQKYASLGTKDLRKDSTGAIDFRIQRQLRSYKRDDPPPIRVKPVPVSLVLYILRVAYNITRRQDAMAIADMICIAFFYLLRPGEYTAAKSDTTPFRIHDVELHLGNKQLDLYHSPLHELEAATACSYVFTTQKNGVRNERISHSRTGHPQCCPVRATIRRVLYHRQRHTPIHQPLATYYRNHRLTAITPADVTDKLRFAATANLHLTGIKATDISARSLRAGGAMALLCGKVDFDLIKLLGRWHSDAMIRYLHMQAQPIMKQFAKAMFNHGQYDFLPTETVPLRDD